MIRRNPDAFAIVAILLLLPVAWFFSTLRQEVRMTLMPIHQELRFEGDRMRAERDQLRQEGLRMRQEHSEQLREQAERIRQQRNHLRDELRRTLRFRAI